ncbi:hypothetical protein LUW74_48450 [Actinomadura madurae]|nr:hypothetical protein [Actinomadura madurae]URN10410.1 hypothetical protein LUW74_48450 [Actinomadura madurae]
MRGARPGPGGGEGVHREQAATALRQLGEVAQARLAGTALVGDVSDDTGDVHAHVHGEPAAALPRAGVLDRVDGQLVQDEEHVVQGRELGEQVRRERPDEPDLVGPAPELAPPVHRGLVLGDGNGEQH